MLWTTAFLLISQLASQGLAVPVEPDPNDSADLPALTRPVPCRTGPSSKSPVESKYTTIFDLFSSLTQLAEDADGGATLTQADIEAVQNDKDGWVPTDDGCYISAPKALKAVPVSFMNEVLDDVDLFKGIEKRQFGEFAIPAAIILGKVALRVGPKLWKAARGAKKVEKAAKAAEKAKKLKEKGKGKGKEKGRKCKRDEGCEVPTTKKGWRDFVSKSKRKISDKRKEGAKKEAKEKMDEATQNKDGSYKDDWDMEKVAESGCLSAVANLFDEFGYDLLDAVMAGSELAGGYKDAEDDKEVRENLKNLYDSVDADEGTEKPSTDRFYKGVSEFLQKCKGGKVPE